MKNLKIVIARNDDASFNSYLKPCLDSYRVHDFVKIAEIFNQKNDSIFKKYNRGIELLEVEEDDVFCFIHEDVKILDKFFIDKIRLIFDSKKDIGVLGLIGTTEFPEAGGWWQCDHSKHFGHLIQGLPNASSYHMNRGTGFRDNITSIDGFCFFTSYNFLKDYRFDDLSYPDAYHFYDVDTCFSALQNKFKVAVADILMEHKSEGPMPKSWFDTKEKFLTKWRSKGIEFPTTVSQFR